MDAGGNMGRLQLICCSQPYSLSMLKTAGITLLLLIPLVANQLAVNGYTRTSLILYGLSLIVFIAAAGIFGLRVLLSLFKQDHEAAVKAVIGMIIALGMVLLTAVLMVASNPADRARTSGRCPEQMNQGVSDGSEQFDQAKDLDNHVFSVDSLG